MSAGAPLPYSQVPLVDLAEYRNGDTAEREVFVESLGDALRQLGFVRVRGHDVLPGVTEPAYRSSKAFFALSDATKRRYLVAGGAGERGFTAFGAEHARDNPLPDLKEFWHTGRELPAGHALAGLYPPNLWPQEVWGFREAMSGLYAALERCAETLLEAIALYLDEPADTFTRLTRDGNSILRALHYPPLSRAAAVPGAVRAAAHEDINFITLLITSTRSGLELLTREGEWLPIDAAPGELVVDSGDMLQRVSNGVIPATTHRVVNPDDGTQARYSLPFFVHPRPDSVLRVLDSCRGRGMPEPSPDITGYAFLRERLAELGLASEGGA